MKITKFISPRWILTGIMAVGGLVGAYAFKAHDNPVEQLAEEMIEESLGLMPGSIDLTPGKFGD